MKNVKCSAPSESRKIRKPLMERKRRARINDSLEALKDYIVKSPNLRIPITYDKRTGVGKPKLEKADILELTVKYIDLLTKNCQKDTSHANKENLIIIYEADSTFDSENFTKPIKDNNEEVISEQNQKSFSERDVWRPWDKR